MSDLKSRIDALKAKADKVSADIRQAEAMLRELPLGKSVTYLDLTWDAESRRIVYSGKPLIEHKMVDRISGACYLDPFVNHVIANAESLFEEVSV